MDRRSIQSISKTAGVCGVLQSAVDSVHQNWSKKRTVVSQQQGHE